MLDNAKYKGESEQKEYYLSTPDTPWDYSAGFKDTLKTLRVRMEKKGDSVCYKYCHLDPETKRIAYRDEYETKINDGETMLQILRNLGYTQETLVSKIRRTYMIEDIFEVVLDDVAGVGKFIEVELKVEVYDVKAGVAQIEAVLKKMGINEFKQYDRSYVHMIWNPGYEFGTHRSL